MLVFIKFAHVLSAISLIAVTFCCFIETIFKKISTSRLPLVMLILSIIALTTGTFLVPVHFTFHTGWIRAAYLFLAIFIVGTLLIKLNWKYRILQLGLLFGLIIILILITDDAVTKNSLIF